MSLFLIVPLELKFNRQNAEFILRGVQGRRANDWIFTSTEKQVICHWSGICLFKLDYELDDEGLIIRYAHLNRTPGVYKGKNVLQDLVDIHYCILKFLLSHHINYDLFKQRCIPLNYENAKAYILSTQDEWREDPDFKVTNRHFRNQVIDLRLITDKNLILKSFTLCGLITNTRGEEAGHIHFLVWKHVDGHLGMKSMRGKNERMLALLSLHFKSFFDFV